MTNPYHDKQLNPATSSNKPVKSELAKIAKQIDRVRKQVSRLKEAAPYSPALARVRQFEIQHGITSIGQTSWIQTPAQLREYKAFLKTFEKYETRTVRGAKKAREKQMNSLRDIMIQNGWDPDQYSVEDFYTQLNKVDLYGLMNDYGVTSDAVISAATTLMNTRKGRSVTANRLLTEIFGSPVTTSQEASAYNKGTKAYIKRKRK